MYTNHPSKYIVVYMYTHTHIWTYIHMYRTLVSMETFLTNTPPPPPQANHTITCTAHARIHVQHMLCAVCSVQASLHYTVYMVSHSIYMYVLSYMLLWLQTGYYIMYSAHTCTCVYCVSPDQMSDKRTYMYIVHARTCKYPYMYINVHVHVSIHICTYTYMYMYM